MIGYWNQGMRKWSPSEKVSLWTPVKRLKMIARWPPSTITWNRDGDTTITQHPTNVSRQLQDNTTFADEPFQDLRELSRQTFIELMWHFASIDLTFLSKGYVVMLPKYHRKIVKSPWEDITNLCKQIALHRKLRGQHPRAALSQFQVREVRFP